MANVTMYGAEWCGDCRRATRVFEAHGVPFDYVDVDRDQAALRRVRAMNGGRTSGILPTIVFPDGTVLVEPTVPALDAKLAELRATRA